jgi:hypothetical protein
MARNGVLVARVVGHRPNHAHAVIVEGHHVGCQSLALHSKGFGLISNISAVEVGIYPDERASISKGVT